MEIKSIDNYKSEGAKLLSQYGNDKNGDSEVDLNEARSNLSVEEYRKVAAAGDDNPNTISYLDVLTYEGHQISKEVLANALHILEMPKMIDIPGMTGKSIMKGEVTVGLFKQVMEGYKITGHNACELKTILADSSQADDALTYVSLLDAREFAKRLSNLTGRQFRVQAEEEWFAASDKDKLSGNNWTWTEKKYDDIFALRHLEENRYDDRYLVNLPEIRSSDYAVRLVEDLSDRPAGK